jgi:repressor LexA
MITTPRQLEIYDHISRVVETQGQAPTIAEICAHFGLKSTGTVHQALLALERSGLVRRRPNVSRGIELIEPNEQGRSAEDEIPLLGIVAAGRPIEAILSHETVCVPRDMTLSSRAFALRVRGDSMIDEQIRDGDYVIVESRETAENGQTIVALIDGSEATVKRFYSEGDHIRLEAANPLYKPLIVMPRDRLRVQGIVVGIIRRVKN